uniref:Uncharacterized protein n=1 Tax=Phocoena sinus TaxID=42100 RepID=A0A8C9BN99_PHOSS
MHAQRSLRWVPESRSAVQAPTHPTPWTARSKSAWRPGSWSQALGPPFVIGVRGALLRARPEASSRKLFKHRSRQTPRPPGASYPGSPREGADSPAAPREPQLRSRSAQLRMGPDAAPAGGESAVPSSPSEEPFSPAAPPRLQPPSSKAPAASSAPSFRLFF